MKKISLTIFLLGTLFSPSFWAKNNDTTSIEQFLKLKQSQKLKPQNKQLTLEQKVQIQQQLKKQKHTYAKQLSKKLKK